MNYDDVNFILIEEFPEFDVDDYYLDYQYLTAFMFVKFLLQSYKNGNKEIYKRGLDFVERLHFSEDKMVRELATIGYLESFQKEYLEDYINLDVLYNDLGEESKKWWVELKRFWSGENKYVGETYG